MAAEPDKNEFDSTFKDPPYLTPFTVSDSSPPPSELNAASPSSFSKRTEIPLNSSQRRRAPPPLELDRTSRYPPAEGAVNLTDKRIEVQHGSELSHGSASISSSLGSLGHSPKEPSAFYAQAALAGGFSRLPLSSEEISPGAISTTSSTARNYPGLQLGLPFSMSVADSLSSFSSTLQREPSVDELLALDLEAYNRSRSNSLLESPVTDRTKLIGLGELATPRWTSAALERRWDSTDIPPQPERIGEGSESLFSSYQQPIMESYASTSNSTSPSVDRALQPTNGSFSNSYPTHSVHPSDLFPPVQSSTSVNHARAGSLRQNRLDSIARAANESAPPSPTYSLDAVSADEDGQEVLRASQTTEARPARRVRSLASATSRASLGSGVGLGLDYETISDSAALALASAVLQLPETSRRVSSGSAASVSSRRSSLGKGTALEGKSSHLRRASASKSGFSHLPPSPASTSNPRLSGPLPLPSPNLTSLHSPSSTSSTPMGQSQSQPNSAGFAKTPDHTRHSIHAHPGHQSSPSLIAASILRQTRDLHYEEMNTSMDTGAAEALRKLDGLGPSSSPRLSKSYTSSVSTSISRSRTTSRDAVSPSRQPPKDADKKKSRGSITSGGDSPLISMNSNNSSPAITSGSFSTAPSPAPLSKSPILPLPPTQTSRLPTQARPTSSTSEVPFPSTSPFKRGSSVSTSIGTSTSGGGSRDSTSGTSLSGSSINVNRSTSSKNRRGSAGSDVSSIHSAGEASITRSDQMESREGDIIVIPPVPPIPKDYETYRPSTGGTSSSSATNSPRFGPARRPSESSLADSLLSPKSSEMEASTSGGSSQGRTPPKKWSISGAFGKSKSPKPPPVESNSSHNLSASTSSAQSRVTTASNTLSDPYYPRRLAGSTNDIAGLAGSNQGSSSPSGLTAKVRQSLRSDKPFSSALPRTRTSSMSSTITLTKSLITPALVATSPGRSRSSLLSPRQRTPSGIPFFSRKSSSSNIVGLGDTSLNVEKSVEKPNSSPEGRRSILGLNFLRSTASRREKEKLSPSPILKRSVGPSEVSEFGVRPNLVTKASSLVTRKRGKTLSGAEVDSPPDARPSNLPPMQIAALTASTLKRVDSLTSSASSSSLSARAQLTPNKISTPSRSLRLDSSIKANLPTIAGSPSSNPLPPVSRRTSNIEELKPGTPTKIPRLQYRADGASPALIPKSSVDVFLDPVSTHRRASYFGATPETSLPSIETNDFGVTTREPGLSLGERTLSTRRRQQSGDSLIPRSRSIATILAAPIQAVEPVAREGTSSAGSSRATTALPRSFARGSLVSDETKPTLSSSTPRLSTTPLRISASASTSRISTIAADNASVARRVPTKVLETPVRRASNLVSASEVLSSARSSRLSSSSTTSKIVPPARVSRTNTPSISPAPTLSDSSRSVSSSSHHVTEDELRGDEEMSAYVRRQQTKKMAAGMSSDLIRKMFDFPEDTLPLPALSSRDAASLYSRYLTDYEREEIREHPIVYYAGNKILKQPASKEVPLNNFGFDDERGDYLLVPHDHILYRYEVIDVLGKGSFGQVLQCRDHKTGEMVAIKIIRNKKRFHHQALVEIKVLENLVKWDPEEKHFVIRMVDSFTFRSHLCIVTELLSINLYELVKANSFVGFSTALIRRFTVQILGSLSLLRHHRVVHCDLKPENILLKHPAKSAIKVIDFGSSCFEHEKVYTYIQSRFYRSPEVILGMNYHMAIDMWSLGCILAEMFTGYPIFPGENEQEQLACIMEVLGLPDKYLVDRSSRKKLFFDSTGAPRPVTNSKGKRRRPGAKSLAQVLKSDDELFVDFISKCLAWDPDRRLKPDPAMRHPWITQSRQRTIAPSVVPPRIGRASLGSSSGSASISLDQISTPRKKVAQSTTTAASLRPRTQSTIVTKSSALPPLSGAQRYSVANL